MPDLLPVTKVQRFSTHDGPGIRTTVFLKGCPLRCAWCHNPETQESRMQLMYAARLCCGCQSCAAVCPHGAHRFTVEGHRIDRTACTGCCACVQACPTGACEAAAALMDIPTILEAVMQDAAFYGADGGLTLSGGEPMAHPEGTLTLLRSAKAQGLHTALETCGYFPEEYLPALADTVNLFLWDFKDSDDHRHRQYTGVSNEVILRNLRQLDELGAAIELRCILVKGVNLNDRHLDAIADHYHALHHCTGVTLLPYHTFGSSKAQQLSWEDSAHPEWIPTADDMAHVRQYLLQRGVPLLD